MPYASSDPRLIVSYPFVERGPFMIGLRLWYVLMLAFLFTPALGAQDKPASPWAIDRSLTVTPQTAPTPALTYRLLPPSWELKDGNAVPIYLRLVHEQNDAARKYWSETPLPWNKLPVDKVPLDEARKFLEAHRNFLRQIELGARRRTAEWNYTLDAGDPIGLLLPDVQWMRKYNPMLILQVRVALAEGDFKSAAHHLETGFAFSRHIAEGPFYINNLVAIALASQFAGTVADFIERPDAPNLYWALTALPHPLIVQRRAQDIEYRMLEMVFPELADLDRERTGEQWDAILRRIRSAIRNISMEGKPPKLPNWFPAQRTPEEPAANSPDLSAARAFVARTKGLPAEKVEAMPPAQVMLLYFAGTYSEKRDDLFRALDLPYPQARTLLNAAVKRLREIPSSEGEAMARALLPALDRVTAAQARIERNLHALRVIEALRIYAAAHDGRLPVKLGNVTEVPVPDDPGTGQPFEYSRDGDTATLVSQVPDDSLPNNGIRYRVSVRKK
jgi:hypothetical protein